MSQTESTYKVLSLKEVLETDPNIEWTIDRIAPKQTIGLLAGDSGIGKTWVVLDLAIAIATGSKWLGKYPTAQGSVMIVDEENAIKLLSARLTKLLKSKGYKANELPISFIVGGYTNFSPNKVNGLYKMSDEFKKLVRTFDKHTPAWASFDSLTRVHRANENASNEMSAAFASVKRLVDDTGTGLLFTHHLSKKSQIRGSTDIKAFYDYVMIIDRHELGVRVKHEKSRWDEPVDPFVIRFDKSKDSFALNFAGHIASDMVKEDALEKSFREIRGLMSYDLIDRRTLIDQAEEMGICKQRQLDKVLKWAAEMGYVERISQNHNVHYRLNGVDHE